MEGLYSPGFSLWFTISAIVAVGCLILTVAVCLEPYRRVRRAALEESETDANAGLSVKSPGISIVVHAEGDDYVISDFIRCVQEQNYGNFEVIVVNDASAADTAMLAEKFESDPRVYFTFIPPGSQVLSRHKMALTIGIKAAKKEIILTTTAHARPLSANWLAGIARAFGNDARCGAVLATSEPDFGRLPFARLMHAVRSARWIAAALNRRPYRGTGYNLAFRKTLFFSNKGYSRGILLEGGEDDLFIESIAEHNSITVLPGMETRVMLDWQDSTRRLHKAEIHRHRESGKHLGYRGVNYWRSMWIMNILIILGACGMTWFYPYWVGLCASVLIILIAAIAEMVTLSRLSKVLTDKNIPESDPELLSADPENSSEMQDSSDSPESENSGPSESSVNNF